jgi:RNA polymerase sigma factor (sigma-70 family)
MKSTDEKFRDLMDRVLTGSDEAAHELFERYGPLLLYVVRRKLNKQLRSKFDSLDFTQDVWASFFAEPADKRSFANPQELIAFLTALAHNKLTEATRQRMVYQKFNLNREQSLDDPEVIEKENLIGTDATPSQIVSSEEEWQEFVRRQPPVHQRVYILLREGKTTLEIAAEVGLTERTIRRIANRLDPGSLS